MSSCPCVHMVEESIDYEQNIESGMDLSLSYLVTKLFLPKTKGYVQEGNQRKYHLKDPNSGLATEVSNTGLQSQIRQTIKFKVLADRKMRIRCPLID